MSFVNLYYKSEYSLLQSSCSLDKTFALIKKYGYDSLAITDEGTMYGAFKFYQKAKANGIKPIIGLKVKYDCNGIQSNILLYAMNNFGYHNLMKISSLYMIKGKKIDINELMTYSIGILAVIPFSESILNTYYFNKNYSSIFEHINILKSSFDQLYIGLSKQTKIEHQILNDCYEMFSGHNINMVALSKISFLESQDTDVYMTLRSIEQGGEMVKLTEKETNEYIYTLEEMEVLFQEHLDLIEETKRISDKCNVTIDTGHYLLPKYSDEIDADKYLKELSLLGLRKRIQHNQILDITPYINRLNYELDTIKEMGFSDYFLIVWDYIKFAKTNNIYVGPGRGSAPASLVCYSLGISDVDPIKYNILFERFLNKERITMPDIDTDFPDDKRDEVIKYVGKKYGQNRVAHIATFGTFKAKLALRDVSRVFKLPELRLKEVLKCINTYSMKELFATSFSEIVEKDEMLKRLMEDYDDINQVVSIALKLEGLPRNVSTHAAGIIITKNDLVHYTPLVNGLDGIYQSQFEASDLEQLGLLKMDFLGLRNLTIIDETIKLIKESDPKFTLPKEMNDQPTFKMLASGDVSGVFQLESPGMRKVLMDLKVSSFEDIAHALALYRPGPMDMIPHFINRKFGREKIIYPHPDLEPILKETYGTIVYQEQIMLIARKFAGYSLGRADVLRRAVSKKKLEVLEAERETFVKSSINQGYSEKTANDIYDYIVKFASYGFNKAHSIAYAKVSYQTAFLKCHYPAYYIATLLSSVIGSDTDIKLYCQEAMKRKIDIISPMINESKEKFCVINNKILFPLTVIRGLGAVKVDELLKERNKQKFLSFEDFVKRTANILGGTLIENVIYSGALDEFGLTKKAMIDNYRTIIDRMSYDFVTDFVPCEYDKEEFSYRELLEQEKNMIGINLKYNFMNQYRHLYDQFHALHIKDLEPNKDVCVLGFIQKINIIKTKNNENMAFINLADDVDTIELTLFPQEYQKYRDIVVGQLAIVIGRTQVRNKLQIVVKEIRKV